MLELIPHNDEDLKLKTNEIALEIVRNAQIIFEKIIFGTEEKISINEIYKNINIEGEFKEYRDFNLGLFDEPYKYYNDLKKYVLISFKHIHKYGENEISKIKKSIDSNISIYYLSVLFDVLIEILEKSPKAHEDDIIKFDISVICELFRQKNKRFCSSNSFFWACVNELLEKYSIIMPNKNDFRKKFFEKEKVKAHNTLGKIKANLSKFIQFNLKEYCAKKDFELNRLKTNIKNQNDYLNYENKLKDFEKLDKLSNENINISYNYEETKKLYGDKNVFSYFEDYAEYLVKKRSYAIKADQEKYKEYIKNNCLIPLDILKIDENDEMNIHIISVIDYSEDIIFLEESPYGETFYEKFLDIKEELEYLNQKSYDKEINELLSDKSFFEEFLNILKSENVKHYLNSVIEFPNSYENDYNVKIYLGKRYNSFIEDIEKNFNFFKKLIILKQLGYKIPSCTGPSMRIFLNPRLHFSQEAIQNDSQRKSILKSALIILLLHEIAHLLKYYPIKNEYQKEYPLTPKNKEKGRCLIYQLFKTELIKKISYHQSMEVNNFANWNDSEKLKTIFEKDDTNSEQLKEKEGELDLYFSDSRNSDSGKKKKFGYKTDYCWWW